MLVHICCSVDSHFFLQRLQESLPEASLTGYFYNPNIHPEAEYRLRLLDVQRSCKMLGITLIEELYDARKWFEATKGFEHTPERGERCKICFEDRLWATAKKARELGIDVFTTTLLTSPKKNLESLKNQGESIANRFGRTFFFTDFRKNGGTQRQFRMAKEDALYKQNYCGCMFALNDQRQQQGLPAKELFCALGNQILPGSIEEKLALYARRSALEKEGISYRIQKYKYLEYRLLKGLLLQEGVAVPSYICTYSMLGKTTRFLPETIHEGVGYAQKDGILLVSLSHANALLQTAYSSIRDILQTPPSFNQDLSLRKALTGIEHSFNPIVIIDEPKAVQYEIFIDSRTYEGDREHLISF